MCWLQSIFINLMIQTVKWSWLYTWFSMPNKRKIRWHAHYLGWCHSFYPPDLVLGHFIWTSLVRPIYWYHTRKNWSSHFNLPKWKLQKKGGERRISIATLNTPHILNILIKFSVLSKYELNVTLVYDLFTWQRADKESVDVQYQVCQTAIVWSHICDPFPYRSHVRNAIKQCVW